MDVPPDARGYRHVRRKLLDEMAGLMVQDAPDLVLLQEVPVWAGPLLRELTGMGVTLAPAYGAHVPFVHVPLPLAVGAAVGRALPDLVRTQFEGQANAVLYGAGLLLVSARRAQVNERRRLRGEPRIAQLVRLRHRAAGREFVVANVHLDPGDNREQVERARLPARTLRPRRADDPGRRRECAGQLAGRARARAAGLDRGLVPTCPHRPHLRPRLPDGRPAHALGLDAREIRLEGALPVRLSDHDPVDAVISW